MIKPHNTAMRSNLIRFIAFSLLALLMLIVFYWLAERYAFENIEPGVLEPLRLLRTFALTSWAAAVVTALLLAQLTQPGRLLPSLGLRARIMLPMTVTALVPVLAIGAYSISQTREAINERALSRIELEGTERVRRLENHLKIAQQDLLFLRQTRTLRSVVSSIEEPSERLYAELSKEMEFYSSSRNRGYSIYLLSVDGRELFGLEAGDAMARGALLSEEKQGVLAETLALQPGQVAVGERRRAISYSSSVEDNKAVLVLAVPVETLLPLVYPLPADTEVWLLDTEQRYLGYIGADSLTREVYRQRNRRLADDYSQSELGVLLSTETAVLRRGERLLVSAPVVIDEAQPERGWRLIMAFSATSVDAPVSSLMLVLSLMMILLVAGLALVAAGVGYLTADYLTAPVERLRRATHEVAEGNLDKQVEVGTGDEIAELARDFNIMTERLRQSQQRLAGWNEELRLEVERRTEDLRRLQAGLARADRLSSIGQMTAGVMHEIGNPLAAIKTKIQVAEEAEEFSESYRRLLDEIVSEVDRLTLFLRSFSRLLHIDRPTFQMVDPVEVVESVVSLVSAQLRRRGLELCVVGYNEPLKIRADANRVRQMLINLILNASDASQPGGRIIVEVALAGLGVSISVIDNGSGIPEELLDKVIHPFFTTRAEGTGLGLAICKQIVEEHGGWMRLESRLGEGTRVTTFFPFGEQNEEDDADS